ncbi:hypothetical protein [Bacillus sp. FJAT-29814]|nr:hypothetical protein [Bacillus sp. FJAT-29814]
MISELERVKELYPNMFGLEVWDEEKENWFKWEDEVGKEIRDYIL